MDHNVLEKPKAISIVLVIHRSNDEMWLVKLISAVKGNFGTVNSRINELEKYGLVEFSNEKKFQGKKLIKLTRKGKVLAEYLDKIGEIPD
jgi:predicted transcriptional regulator